MTIDPLLLSLAVVLNLAAAAAALHKQAVSTTGALGGFIVGAVTLYVGGFLFWVTLMLFFGSSTVASRLGSSLKTELSRVHEKGSRRDIVQVFANAGVPTAALVLLWISGEPSLAVAAAAGYAGANADTWASEIGVLSSQRPRSIITRQELVPGTSGGTTRLGTTAASAGSLLIALWFAAGVFLDRAIQGAILWSGAVVLPERIVPAAGAVFLAGSLGTLIDSILGATVQAQFRAPDGSYTERRYSKVDDEIRKNELVRGVRWISNDTVNLLSTLFAALFAFLIYRTLE
jgi:uncharacterized protein (TIGR00297 family)